MTATYPLLLGNSHGSETVKDKTVHTAVGIANFIPRSQVEPDPNPLGEPMPLVSAMTANRCTLTHKKRIFALLVNLKIMLFSH